ncbi:hypothetical protein D3C73_1383440 [compost metagenome]
MVIGALSIQRPVIECLIFLQNRINFGSAAPQLVTQRHHHEGRMIAERLKDLIALADQIILLRLIVAFIGRFRNCSPERQLRLHVDSEQIRSCKRRFRRAAGMEPVMINAVGLGDA